MVQEITGPALASFDPAGMPMTHHDFAGRALAIAVNDVPVVEIEAVAVNGAGEVGGVKLAVVIAWDERAPDNADLGEEVSESVSDFGATAALEQIAGNDELRK